MHIRPAEAAVVRPVEAAHGRVAEVAAAETMLGIEEAVLDPAPGGAVDGSGADRCPGAAAVAVRYAPHLPVAQLPTATQPVLRSRKWKS